MKTKLTYFLLGFAMTLLMSATVAQQFMTVKPATPTHTLAYTGTNPHTFVREWSRKGYIVISTSSKDYHNTFVVMAKYD